MGSVTRGVGGPMNGVSGPAIRRARQPVQRRGDARDRGAGTALVAILLSTGVIIGRLALVVDVASMTWERRRRLRRHPARLRGRHVRRRGHLHRVQGHDGGAHRLPADSGRSHGSLRRGPDPHLDEPRRHRNGAQALLRAGAGMERRPSRRARGSAGPAAIRAPSYRSSSPSAPGRTRRPRARTSRQRRPAPWTAQACRRPPPCPGSRSPGSTSAWSSSRPRTRRSTAPRSAAPAVRAGTPRATSAGSTRPGGRRVRST